MPTFAHKGASNSSWGDPSIIRVQIVGRANRAPHYAEAKLDRSFGRRPNCGFSPDAPTKPKYWSQSLCRAWPTMGPRCIVPSWRMCSDQEALSRCRRCGSGSKTPHPLMGSALAQGTGVQPPETGRWASAVAIADMCVFDCSNCCCSFDSLNRISSTSASSATL